MKRVAVVGGGVSGLALCYALERQVPDVELTLFEPGQIGGKVQTLPEGDFVIEEGADSFLLKANSKLEHLLDELKLLDRLIAPREREFAIQRDGKLHYIPLGMLKGFPDNLLSLWRCSLFSFVGKLSATVRPALRYFFEREIKGDPSIAESLRARYGSEVSQYFFETVFGGIHSGDANKLSFRSLYPDMANPKSKQGSKYSRARFVSFPSGMKTFTEAIVNSLLYTTVESAKVSSVTLPDDGRYSLKSETGESFFDAVVLATPSHVSGEIVQELSADLGSSLLDIPHSSSAIATLLIQRDEITKEPRGSGYLMAPGERGFVTGCTYSSQKWESRAPEHTLLVRIFFGRNGGVSDVSDEELERAAISEVREKLGYQGTPTKLFMKRWEKGLPQYECGHSQKLARINQELAKFPGLFLTGTSFRGVGIPDCVKQSFETASEVAEFLEEESSSSIVEGTSEKELAEYGTTVCA